MKRARRIFTNEFNLETVKLVKESDKSIGQTAKDLDLTESALRNWVKQYEIDQGEGPPGALTTVERDELRCLRRENQQLRMERDLLKKATAFFAKESK